MRVSEKEYKMLLGIRHDVIMNHTLTVDGLRIVCDAFGRDPYKIGVHMLEVLAMYEARQKPYLKL